MKFRSYIWILALLLILSGGLYFLSDRWSTTGNEFNSLLPKEQNGIDHIYIQSEFDTLEFVKVGTEWTYIGELLNQQAVENLLLAGGRLTMKSILPIEELEEVNYMLDLVFLKGSKVSGAYSFVRAGNEYYIFSPNSKQAFGIELIGFENIPLEKIFSVEVDHYRKHMLISLLPSEIQEIEIVPIKGRAFRANQDNDFNISVTDLNGNDMNSSIDERKIRLLFSYFSTIRYNELISKGVEDDKKEPDALVKVKDFQGNRYSLKVFQWKEAGEKKPDIFEALVVFNDESDTLSIDYYYLDLLLRGLEKYLTDQSG